jgi:general secretion pathway protein E
MKPSKVKKPDLRQEVEGRIMEYMNGQGYKVTSKASVRGQSGVEHVFDVLAQRDDGFTIRTIALGIAKGGDAQAEASAIFNFANKAFDTGIKERVLIAIPKMSLDSKKLADKQRIKVFDEEKLDILLSRGTKKPVKMDSPKSFATKADLIKSLENLGYRIQEMTKVTGKSGVEHTFDVMAYDNGAQDHNLGIDMLLGEHEVQLDKIALFDTKAYDTGIFDKVVVISGELSPEAQRFAQAQGIKVIQLDVKGAKTKKKTEAAQEIEVKVKTSPDIISGDLRRKLRPEALALIPEVLARRYIAMPIAEKNGNTLEVAMADPTNILALEAFTAHSKRRIKPIAADAKEIREAIDFHYKDYGEIEKHLSRISVPVEATDERLAFDAAVDAPLARALDLIIDEAVKARASDIHIEPELDRLRVRYRIDGTLQDMMSLPLSVHPALISRVKILADMNIADHHHAQDGQFTTNSSGRDIDIRVATSPTVGGEMAVLRLLDKSLAALEMSDLGMLPETMEKYESMLKIPYGMILISGPTGAGKTTTLYASINSLDTMGRNVITIEDPAEYRFKDINQIQVNVQAGITFASGLRSILRLDPDVILVGEVRDSETANIPVQAALTGHLMLTSIHANDTTGVLFRLLDLGVEPFLIASAVIGLVAQRMVRRICPYCNKLIEVSLVEQLAYERETGKKKAKFLYGTGCKACAFTGYLGRVGIFEIFTMSDHIRRMLVSGTAASEIREQAIKEGMTTMMNDGMSKVAEDITTPSEVLRSAYSPEEQYLR